MLDHLLVPFSRSTASNYLLSHVHALAQMLKAHVTILRVLESSESVTGAKFVDPLDWQFQKTEAEAQLEKSATYLQSGDINVEKILLEGSGSVQQIIDFASQHEVSLIIIPNAEEVVKEIIFHTGIPTLLIPTIGYSDAQTVQYKKLLVPLDGSQRAEYVLPLAIAFHERLDAQLVLAHIVRIPETPRHAPLTSEDSELVERLTSRNREEAERYLELIRARLSSNTETRLLVSDNPAASLHKLVEDESIDLVILSAHGYSGQPKWPYGSITNTFLAYSTKPIVVVQDLPFTIEKASEPNNVPRESGVR